MFSLKLSISLRLGKDICLGILGFGNTAWMEGRKNFRQHGRKDK